MSTYTPQRGKQTREKSITSAISDAQPVCSLPGQLARQAQRNGTVQTLKIKQTSKGDGKKQPEQNRRARGRGKPPEGRRRIEKEERRRRERTRSRKRETRGTNESTKGWVASLPHPIAGRANHRVPRTTPESENTEIPSAGARYNVRWQGIFHRWYTRQEERKCMEAVRGSNYSFL